MVMTMTDKFDDEDNQKIKLKTTLQPWPVPAVPIAVCPKRNAPDQVFEEKRVQIYSKTQIAKI